ncbi:hypothetical protein RSOLAG22IIIB_11697 [Rhizoctonia solani]|uniref:Uncharacterized protein n=1 Tax=Rhizoctonia solani TaxID=456999 RepID=A0A0K6GAF8_9AGAM|nr:hypothetical protein RSOLAG22IIIB_11697 [Rhizoctonia solani]
MLVDELLIVWGGTSFTNGAASINNDNRLFLLNIATHEWIVPRKYMGPPPCARTGHASCICGNKLIVFGGFDEKYEMNLNDLRSLDLSHLRQNYVKWEQIRPAPGSRSPPGRTAHTMVAYENKLYMFGGHGMKGCRNDTCVL